MKQPAPVLVIEDEPSVTAFIRSALERSGYSVVAARSCADALRMLRGGSFTGVVSDMRTPGGMTGADVHAWLAENRPELAGRVIFVTGDIANDETRRLLASTVAPCIEKPFRVQQLISAAGELFGTPEPAGQPA